MGYINNSTKTVKYYDVSGGDKCNCNPSGGGSTPIDPTVIIKDDTLATNKTWSSAKIMVEIQKAVAGDTTVLYDGGNATQEDYDVIYQGGSSTDSSGGTNYDGGDANSGNSGGPTYDGGSSTQG